MKHLDQRIDATNLKMECVRRILASIDGLKIEWEILFRVQADEDDLINDAAAIAESIQPKGNTLSSTNVVTPVQVLLKHTLREYLINLKCSSSY